MRVKAPSRPSGKEPHDEQPLIANGAPSPQPRKTLTSQIRPSLLWRRSTVCLP